MSISINEAYLTQYRYCVNNNIYVDPEGHYQTHIEFGNAPFYVMPDGSDVIRYEFKVDGCLKKKKFKDGGWVYVKSDLLPVYGKVCNNRVKKFFYKYLLFLRCDGIDNRECLIFYMLCVLKNKFVFYTRVKNDKGISWKKYVPQYKNVCKMFNYLIDAVMKKEITDDIREEFIIRTRCVVNPIYKGKFGERMKKTKNMILKDGRVGAGQATINKIKDVYDAAMTNEEIAEKAGVSVDTIKLYKKKKIGLETKEEKIKRMYDPSISERKNAKNIGVSRDTLRKYIEKLDLNNLISTDKSSSFEVLSNSISTDERSLFELKDEEIDNWIDSVLEEE